MCIRVGCPTRDLDGVCPLVLTAAPPTRLVTVPILPFTEEEEEGLCLARQSGVWTTVCTATKWNFFTSQKQFHSSLLLAQSQLQTWKLLSVLCPASLEWAAPLGRVLWLPAPLTRQLVARCCFCLISASALALPAMNCDRPPKQRCYLVVWTLARPGWACPSYFVFRFLFQIIYVAFKTGCAWQLPPPVPVLLLHSAEDLRLQEAAWASLPRDPLWRWTAVSFPKLWTWPMCSSVRRWALGCCTACLL